MSFKVTVHPSGQVFDIEAGQTILEAGLDRDLGFPYSCRDGLCGTCKAIILSGKIDYAGHIPAALTEQEKDSGVALLCQATASSDLDIQLELLAPLPHRKKLPCRVVKKEILSHDVVALWLKFPPSEHMDFRAGQYIDILLPDGRHRSFSIANAPSDEPLIELHIRHVEDGDFTGYCYNEMEVKTILRIEGPLGSFYLREDSNKPIIFMAGGTGFAPIKGIIEYCLAKDIPREMYLYWGAQTERDLYLHDMAQQWAKSQPRFQYVPVLSRVEESRAGESKPDKPWQGRTGLVHQAIIDDFPDLSDFEIYAGGPPAMVYAGKDVFHDRGLPESRYYSDAFEFQDH